MDLLWFHIWFYRDKPNIHIIPSIYPYFTIGFIYGFIGMICWDNDGIILGY